MVSTYMTLRTMPLLPSKVKARMNKYNRVRRQLSSPGLTPDQARVLKPQFQQIERELGAALYGKSLNQADIEFLLGLDPAELIHRTDLLELELRVFDDKLKKRGLTKAEANRRQRLLKEKRDIRNALKTKNINSMNDRYMLLYG